MCRPVVDVGLQASDFRWTCGQGDFCGSQLSSEEGTEWYGPVVGEDACRSCFSMVTVRVCEAEGESVLRRLIKMVKGPVSQ